MRAVQCRDAARSRRRDRFRPYDRSARAHVRTTVPDTPRHAGHGREWRVRSRSKARRIIRRRAARSARKVARYLERTYLERAVLHPLRRVGSKGSGRFERIAGTKRSTRIAARSAAIAASPDGPQAILPYSYAGTMGLLQYCSMDRRFFHRLRRVTARPHHLLDRRQGGLRSNHRRIDRHRSRGVRECEADPDLGLEPDRLEPAPVEPRAGGEAPRRKADRDRSLPQPDRGEVPRAPRAAAGHRRRARRWAMMHVLIAEDLLDHDYIARYTLGFDAAQGARARVPAGARGADHGLTVPRSSTLAREYGTIRPAVDPSELRHAASRRRRHGDAHARACLPALVGAWRDPAGGALLSSSGTYPVNTQGARAARPHLEQSAHDQHVDDRRRAARREGSADPRDLRLQLEPGRGRTRVVAGHRGFRPRGPVLRGPRCISHRYRRTTPTSCCRRRRSSNIWMSTRRTGHLYVLANNPAIAPWARPKPNTEVFRLLAARWASRSRAFARATRTSPRNAFVADHPRAQGIDWETLKAAGWQRPNVPSPFAPFAQGGFRRRRQVRVLFRDAARSGRRSAADLHSAARIGRAAIPCSRARFPLAIICRPRATRSTRPSPTCRCSSSSEKTPAPGHPSRRRSAARYRRPATGRACSTTAARSRLDGARYRQARGSASSWRCRSGGASSRRTATTPTR